MIAEIDINRAAKELLERYGDEALTIAQDRVAALSVGKDQEAMNLALRLLSALEGLLAGAPPAP